MKILFTGASGLVGSRVIDVWQSSTDWEILQPDLDEFSIDSKASVQSYFVKHKPNLVIHAAAATNVTASEKERDDKTGITWKLNVDGTRLVCDECKSAGIFLIQISTDMVFSGLKENPGPYAEYTPIEQDSSKLSWYGWSKAEAERVVEQVINPDKFAIVRISNPVRNYYELKADYMRKIVESYDAGNLHPLFADQFQTLTFIDEVGESIQKIIEGRITGTYHVSSRDLYTPFKLGSYLLKRTRDVEDVVQEGSLERYLNSVGTPARYMQFAGLKVEETQKKLGIRFNTWKETVDALADGYRK